MVGYYAVKCIEKTYLNSENEDVRKRRWHCIEQERQIMERLDNKFIVKYIEPYTSKNYRYLVQELANGGNLKQLLKRYGVVPESIAKKILL